MTCEKCKTITIVFSRDEVEYFTCEKCKVAKKRDQSPALCYKCKQNQSFTYQSKQCSHKVCYACCSQIFDAAIYSFCCHTLDQSEKKELTKFIDETQKKLTKSFTCVCKEVTEIYSITEPDYFKCNSCKTVKCIKHLGKICACYCEICGKTNLQINDYKIICTCKHIKCEKCGQKLDSSTSKCSCYSSPPKSNKQFIPQSKQQDNAIQSPEVMKPKDLATLNTKQEYTSSGHGLKNNVNKEFIATTEESKFLAPEGSKYLSLENSNSEQTIQKNTEEKKQDIKSFKESDESLKNETEPTQHTKEQKSLQNQEIPKDQRSNSFESEICKSCNVTSKRNIRFQQCQLCKASLCQSCLKQELCPSCQIGIPQEQNELDILEKKENEKIQGIIAQNSLRPIKSAKDIGYASLQSSKKLQLNANLSQAAEKCLNCQQDDNNCKCTEQFCSICCVQVDKLFGLKCPHKCCLLCFFKIQEFDQKSERKTVKDQRKKEVSKEFLRCQFCKN